MVGNFRFRRLVTNSSVGDRLPLSFVEGRRFSEGNLPRRQRVMEDGTEKVAKSTTLRRVCNSTVLR